MRAHLVMILIRPLDSNPWQLNRFSQGPGTKPWPHLDSTSSRKVLCRDLAVLDPGSKYPNLEVVLDPKHYTQNGSWNYLP